MTKQIAASAGGLLSYPCLVNRMSSYSIPTGSQSLNTTIQVSGRVPQALVVHFVYSEQLDPTSIQTSYSQHPLMTQAFDGVAQMLPEATVQVSSMTVRVGKRRFPKNYEITRADFPPYTQGGTLVPDWQDYLSLVGDDKQPFLSRSVIELGNLDLYIINLQESKQPLIGHYEPRVSMESISVNARFRAPVIKDVTMVVSQLSQEQFHCLLGSNRVDKTW